MIALLDVAIAGAGLSISVVLICLIRILKDWEISQ